MFASLQLDVEVEVNVLELEDVDVHWTTECGPIPTSVLVDITIIIVEEPEVTDTHLMYCSIVYSSPTPTTTTSKFDNKMFQVLNSYLSFGAVVVVGEMV